MSLASFEIKYSLHQKDALFCTILLTSAPPVAVSVYELGDIAMEPWIVLKFKVMENKIFDIINHGGFWISSNMIIIGNCLL